MFAIEPRSQQARGPARSLPEGALPAAIARGNAARQAVFPDRLGSGTDLKLRPALTLEPPIRIVLSNYLIMPQPSAEFKYHAVLFAKRVWQKCRARLYCNS